MDAYDYAWTKALGKIDAYVSIWKDEGDAEVAMDRIAATMTEYDETMDGILAADAEAAAVK